MPNLDFFFKLGEKATNGDPVRKAKFDYNLYWIVFLAFVSLAVNYYYNFFFKGAGFSTLTWGIVITIFCWFNYWGLVAFRGVYQNMKSGAESLAKIKQTQAKPEEVDEMMSGFDINKKNETLKGGNETQNE